MLRVEVNGLEARRERLTGLAGANVSSAVELEIAFDELGEGGGI